MNIHKSTKRTAISPVLATVILIAITLIAAVAIAGFVFGLFGSFTSSAQVSASITSCVASTGVCTIQLTNTGTSNVIVNSCAIQDNGASDTATTRGNGAPSATFTVAAGGQEKMTCTASLVGPPAWVVPSVGSQAIGSLSMSNGATVPFSGVWS